MWHTITCDNGPGTDQSVYLDGNVTQQEANRFFKIALEFEPYTRISLFRGKNIGRHIKTETKQPKQRKEPT